MRKEGYPLTIIEPNLFTFTSQGKKGTILKALVFEEVDLNEYNLALIDYIEDTESWSDMAITNNGDVSKIMKTVLIGILDFLQKNPRAIIAVEGNTRIKILFYNRIFKTYYSEYRHIIHVSSEKTDKLSHECIFDKVYSIFYICKKA